MAQTAAHLAGHVIPPFPVRQRVISVPKRMRGVLADRSQVMTLLSRIILDERARLLCDAAGVPVDSGVVGQARPQLLLAIATLAKVLLTVLSFTPNSLAFGLGEPVSLPFLLPTRYSPATATLEPHGPCGKGLPCQNEVATHHPLNIHLPGTLERLK